MILSLPPAWARRPFVWETAVITHHYRSINHPFIIPVRITNGRNQIVNQSLMG
ncbi:MAG: hypothetical protein H6658_01010 [Ardenticatenaceae bacterium]|nr:hypothetical protein [Ardenticatenaceae bacterium]